MKHYDVIVIGSGGGSKITRPAANLGFKVAVIEKDMLGGTCLNHGCIPSKMLIHPADVVAHIQDAKKYDISIDTSTLSVDFESLVSRVNQTTDADSNSIAPMYNDHPNIDLYRGTAVFLDNRTLQVGDVEMCADRFFIATGARAHVPPIPGLDGTPYLTYKTALRLKKQPKSMIVLGAGYIAVELGYFFGMTGTDMTFFVRSQFLRHEDHDIKKEFTADFSKRFNILLKTCPSHVSYDGKEFSVTYTNSEGEHTATAEHLLLATGVTPNTDGIGLERTDITLDRRGYIKVNEFLETDAENIYAFGDVIGRYLFRHNANFEGEYLFDNVFKNKEKSPIDYPPMPHAVFSHPQIGSVGQTEEQLIKSSTEYIVGKNSYKQSAMGMALLSESGLAKLLFCRKSKRLLGAHIVGEEASNMVHMLIAYMNMNATLDDMLRTIYIHPALPEIVRNAARQAKKAFELDVEANI